MESIFKKTITVLTLSAILLGVTACATKGGINNDGDTRRVGNVVWSNQIDTDVNDLLAQQVATDEARLIFIRMNDNLPEQTSANIAINNRFQVSLHSGNYTVVNSCVGNNELSAHATGFKNNNLLADKKSYELIGGQTYFFYVEMNKKGQSNLQQITSDSALPLLKSKRYQNHQVSRVTLNCAPPIIAGKHTVVSPVITTPKSSVLEEKIIIDLEVLFETDKAIVRPEYYAKITELAEFMRDYPTTDVTIEGHTDSRGKDAYNQALSQRRVDAVKEVLISQFGIASDRLSTVGYGETQPRASNDTVEGRQLNRRVIAVIEERLRK